MAGDVGNRDPRDKRDGEIRLLVVRDGRPVTEFRLRHRTLWRTGAWMVGGAWLLPIIVLGAITVHARLERAQMANEVASLTRQAETLSTNIASLERYAGITTGTAGAGGPATEAPPSTEAAATGASSFLGDLWSRFSTVRNSVKERVARIRSTPQGVPVISDRTSSGFGWRANPFTGEGAEWHSGLDVPAPLGTPVKATADGVVEWAGEASALGLGVSIKHADGYTTLFGHLHDATVKSGDVIKRGQIVGHVGTGGRSTGPHVHYEVRRNGAPVDPRAVRPPTAPTPR